jgi:hypothetical protein
MPASLPAAAAPGVSDAGAATGGVAGGFDVHAEMPIMKTKPTTIFLQDMSGSWGTAKILPHAARRKTRCYSSYSSEP